MDDDSLPRLYDERAPLSSELTRRNLRALLAALAELHDNGRKHGDLYVNHVLLAPDGRIELVGDGLAADEEDDRLKAGVASVPPERILGEPTTAASDIWQVGVFSYWMLTGHRPLEGTTFPEVVEAVKRSKPADMDPSLPSDLIAFTMRCLQRAPSDRFANAREALAAL